MAISAGPRNRFLEIFSCAPYQVRQVMLGLGYSLVPRRIPNILPLAALFVRDLPRSFGPLLPHIHQARRRPDGLCGLAGRLDVAALLAGYRRGLFVMSHIGPLKWWAPRQRMVLFFDRARVEKNTRRLLRNRHFQVTFDQAFGDVMRACAAPRPGQPPLTWITPRVQSLFQEAHEQGHAHSVEVWQGDELVGGVYGLSTGWLFFTESQFHTTRDASKVGFAVLNRHLQAWGYAMNDCKHETRYLAGCGCRVVTRDEFTSVVGEYADLPGPIGPWQVDQNLLGGDWEPAAATGIGFRDLLPHGSALDSMTSGGWQAHRSNTW